MDRELPTITDAGASAEGETPLRILVLGSLYAAAITFAVAFSPAVGLLNQQAATHGDRIATAEQAR